MKKESPKNKQAEIKVPEGAERFTAHVEKLGKYALGEVYDFSGQSYRLVAILSDTDGLALEFVRVQ